MSALKATQTICFWTLAVSIVLAAGIWILGILGIWGAVPDSEGYWNEVAFTAAVSSLVSLVVLIGTYVRYGRSGENG